MKMHFIRIFKVILMLTFWNINLFTYVFVTWAATWQNQQNVCAPSEDSDQPGHPPSLIRVFAIRIKKAWVFSYPLSAQRRLWSDWRMPRLILVFAWRTVTLLVLSCRGSRILFSAILLHLVMFMCHYILSLFMNHSFNYNSLNKAS